MSLHDITRGNLLECVLAAGAILGRASEREPMGFADLDMERLTLLADAHRIADAVAPLDPVAANVIREGVNRVLNPPDETVIDQTITTPKLESYVPDPPPEL